MLFVLFSCFLAGGEGKSENALGWEPKVSIEELWRWNSLESFKDFNISMAAKGKGDEIWFAHLKGLLKYDGKKIESYPFPERPSGTHINDLLIATDGRIFLKTEGHLYKFENGSFSKTDAPNTGINRRNLIVELASGQILAIARDQINEFSKGRLTPIEVSVDNPAAILVDSAGKLWVAEKRTHSIKVFDLVQTAEGLAGNLIHSFRGNPENTIAPKLFEDSKGKVWVIDPDDQDRCFCYSDYKPELGFVGLKQLGLWDKVIGISEMNTGEIWISVSRKLGFYDGKNFTTYDIKDFPLPGSFPYLLYLANDRLLIGGINQTPKIVDLSANTWLTYEGLNFQCEDEQSQLWFITHDRKIVILSEGKWKCYDVQNGLIDSPNRVFAGSDGSIWVSGSHSGIAAISCFFRGKWKRFVFPKLAKTISHLAVIETKNGAIVFGGGTESFDLGEAVGGAVIFRKNGNEYIGMHVAPPAFITRSANIVGGEDDLIWQGDVAVSLTQLNDLTPSRKLDLFNDQWIDHMLVDGNGHVWVACGGVGIYEFDGSSWYLHGRDDGIDELDVVYLLLEQSTGNLLALTGSGFYRYDGSSWGNWKIPGDTVFKRENHTVFQTSDNAIWINNAKRSWFLEGLPIDKDEFKTVRYLPDSDAPETAAKIASKRFPEGSQVQILFEAHDVWDDTPGGEMEYSYKLNDEKWSSFFRTNSITLNDVDSGSHILQVRARDKNGNIDSSPATIAFDVIAPVWKQGWFILTILLLVVLICFLIFKIFQIRVRAALAIDAFKLEFFTSISHELRNPLAVIISPAELLLKKENNEDSRHKLQIILRNARKMQGMVDQLLQFRKLEQGKWVLRPSGGEVVGFIKESIQNFEPLWLENGQSVKVRCSQNSYLCNFDSAVIQKIVDNLLSNAIKYSGPNTEIFLDVEVVAKDGHMELSLCVEDEGPGIPLHEQTNVLSPFYRVNDSAGKVGSGVGLALVNQLVNLCGGTLRIESPVAGKGKGTRFAVSIPVETYEKPVPEEFLDDHESEVENEKPQLLIVEDNDDFRYIVCQELSDQFNVIDADNGLTGQKMAQEKNPDLIISDVMMPGLGGYSLCEKLKTDPETSHIPIILLTAKSAADHVIEGLKVGADAYITKPLDFIHLRARINNLLETRRELRNKFSKQIVVEPTELTVTPTDEGILVKAIKIVDEHMQDEDFDVLKFGELMGMSQSSLKRKLKAMTGQTPQPFIQKMRLKRAAALISNGKLSVSEAAVEVGIYNMSYFSKIFRKEFGISPSSYTG